MPRRVPDNEARESGLTAADLESLRTAVAEGRRPRVMLTGSAGQVAGRAGQLVRLDDPSAAEWLVVRVGGDELPFAPSDLRLPGRAAKRAPRPPGTEASRVEASEPAPARAAPTEPSRPEPSRPEPSRARAAPTEPSGPERSTAQPFRGESSPVQPSRAGPSGPEPSRAEESAGPGKPVTTRRPARHPADLTVTLTCHDGQWTVQASRGARTMAKPAPVRPAEALRMVGMLDSSAVRDAVEEVVTAARAEAGRQAERLRRELAAVEATLAELGGG